MVQKVVEDVTAEPFEVTMGQLIFQPLRMSRSDFHQPPSDTMNTARGYGGVRSLFFPGRWRLFPQMAAAGLWSTPQDLALIDARRGIAMFRRVDVPVLGIVENMSYFLCPHCGERSDPFGHGGAKAEAERLGVPFLGEVPLEIEIRETSDAGLPIVATKPDSTHAKIYRAIAASVRDQMAGGGKARAAPRIVIES